MQAVNMLAEGGRVARKLPNYEPRPQQIEMAEAVAAAFEAGKHLLVEAGTGVGKSFAYLIPAIERVIRHGGRIVISTHTIALQEQLIEKDIPFLRSIFPEEFSAVLVKGRSNYVGLRRLARASRRQRLLFDSRQDIAELHRLEDWAYATTDGTVSDLPKEPKPGVWDRVRSDADDCFGRRCPYYEKCFYQRARRRAAGAQLLIVNHALLFSDLAVRLQGASVLPAYDYVVLDEAHTVENVAGNHFGTNVANTQVYYLLNSLYHHRTGKGILGKKRREGAIAAVTEARRIADEYFGDLEAWQATQRNWNGRLRKPPPVPQNASAALVELQQRLRETRQDAGGEADRSELGAAMERCKALADDIEHWHRQQEPEWVYWMEVAEGWARRITLSGRPIDLGPVLREYLFARVKSVILTSATLSTSGPAPFAYIQGRLALEDERTLKLGSPFNYRTQVKAYLEPKMPPPSAPAQFIPAVCAAIKKYVHRTQGRAFVLFTSYSMMGECADILGSFFEAQEMPLLVQGSGLPRSMMLEKFRTVPRSVLFGTDTFWAGVDVPGDALSNVIIVKLPFAVPNHPLVEARIEQLSAAGRQPFLEFQLPEAILKFRQGIGRLIRTREDRGIIVILDPRVRTKPYGRRFLEALPDCEVVVEP